MCLSCGCGRAHDDHGDAHHITIERLRAAAAAAGLPPGIAASNVAASYRELAEDVSKSAETPELSTTHRPLGTHGLWHDPNAQLPAYVQNIAHALIRGGMIESRAIAVAIGSVKRWASGGGKVTPEVRSAAGKAVAEWEQLKADH